MVSEHEIGSASQFDGYDGVGFELIASHAGLEALSQWSDQAMIAFGDDSGFAEGPTQIGVAQFGPAQTLDLAS